MTPPTPADLALRASDVSAQPAPDPAPELADAGTTADELTDPGTGDPVQPPCEVLPGLWQSGLPGDWALLRDHLDAVVDLSDAGSGPSEQDLGDLTFGKNRSGLLMALVVRELLGCDGRTALQRVRSVRHRAVNNDRFARWISELPAPR